MSNADSPSNGGSGVATVTVHGGSAGYAQQIQAGAHCLTADEPVALGGSDTGPSPYELLLGALGSCTSITVLMYARRKDWPLENVNIQLRHSKQNSAGGEGKLVDVIEREIEFTGPLTEEQRVRLFEIANKCPVHRTLLSQIEIRTKQR